MSNSLKLYTIIAEWQGGTYVQQVQAANQYLAMMSWGQSSDILLLPEIKATTQQKLLAEIATEKKEPMLLTGLQSAWCTSLLIDDCLMLLHIIRTERIVC